MHDYGGCWAQTAAGYRATGQLRAWDVMLAPPGFPGQAAGAGQRSPRVKPGDSASVCYSASKPSPGARRGGAGLVGRALHGPQNWRRAASRCLPVLQAMGAVETSPVCRQCLGQPGPEHQPADRLGSRPSPSPAWWRACASCCRAERVRAMVSWAVLEVGTGAATGQRC